MVRGTPSINNPPIFALPHSCPLPDPKRDTPSLPYAKIVHLLIQTE